MSEMSIGDLAKKSGMRASAIRYYERVGLLPKAKRLNGRRRYDEQMLQRLAVVRFAKHVGLSMSEIADLLDGDRPRPSPQLWREIARRKIAYFEKLITRAKSVHDILLQTLGHRCPKLAERGAELLPKPGDSAQPIPRRGDPLTDANIAEGHALHAQGDELPADSNRLNKTRPIHDI